MLFSQKQAFQTGKNRIPEDARIVEVLTDQSCGKPTLIHLIIESSAFMDSDPDDLPDVDFWEVQT